MEIKYHKASYVKSSMACIANPAKFTFWYNSTLLLKSAGECWPFCYKTARADNSKNFLSMRYYKIGREMSSEISKLLWKKEIPTTFHFEIMTSISFQVFQIKLLPTTEANIALRCHLAALSKCENPWHVHL